MSDEQLGRLIGRPVADGRAGSSRVFNHRWDLDGTFVTLGTIPAAEIAGLSGGLLSVDVPVSLNRLLLDYDHIVICGPVFPHEVVGFSGGTKYLFPGIAGPDIINFTHWLGAVITSSAVIGAGYTPVRAVIDRAAAMVDRPISCVSLVVTHDGVAGLYVGHAAGVLGGGVRALGADAHRQGRPPVPPRAVDHADDVRRSVDGGEGHVQAGARDGRRRRDRHLRAAHHGGQLHPRRDHRRDRLPLPRLLPGAVGPVRALSRRRARALDAREGARDVTTRRPAWNGRASR